MDENSFKRLQKTTYLDLARDFDSSQRRDNRNHINKIKAISDFLQIENGENVLEIGVGMGIHAKYLLDWNGRGFQFIGVDLSRDMLVEARTRLAIHSNFHLDIMDGERLALRDESIDKVHISGSLHQFFDLN